jgi:hypothetical protein
MRSGQFPIRPYISFYPYQTYIGRSYGRWLPAKIVQWDPIRPIVMNTRFGGDNEAGALGRFQGFSRSVSGPTHFLGLIVSNRSIGNNRDECRNFNSKLPPLPTIVCALLGLVLISYGMWNLKLGPQDWRGGVALLTGIGSWWFGFRGVFLWTMCH